MSAGAAIGLVRVCSRPPGGQASPIPRMLGQPYRPAYERAGATWWLANGWLDQLDDLIERAPRPRRSRPPRRSADVRPWRVPPAESSVSARR